MPDQDLEIRGGGGAVIHTFREGGGLLSNNIFSALRASVWSKTMGPPLLDPPLLWRHIALRRGCNKYIYILHFRK